MKTDCKTKYSGKTFVLQSMFCFKVTTVFNSSLNEKPYNSLYT